MTFLPLVRIWILISAWASATGWVLSALHELNGAGYTVAAVIGLAAGLWMREGIMAGGKELHVRGLRTRFSSLLPLAFAGLAAMVLLGGALYAPSNYDGLTYRLPRVLHWLADGRWHWIHTLNYRMNNRSCGFEWLMAPLLVTTRSDRLLFLANFLPFLLLPGLTFSVFSRLGINRRAAWHWMWLLPTGYCFLLQAASLGNDAFAAMYALASVDFALRARTSGKAPDAWFSLLAAALLTGAKAGNLPLLLPWFIAFLPAARQLLSRPLSSLLVGTIALLASILPTAILNSIHCGDWTGLSLEQAYIEMHNPLVGICGNSAMFLIANLVPTFFPMAGWWNHHFLTWLPHGIGTLVQTNFEGDFYQLGEIPTEESSGLGFGLSCLLAITVAAAIAGRSAKTGTRTTRWNALILVSPYVSLLFFFAKSGMMTLARLVSPYYPLLLPFILRNNVTARLARSKWWRYGTWVVLLLAASAVVLTPARPLWPAKTLLARLDGSGAASHLVSRAKQVYLVYAERPDPLDRVRAVIGDNCPVIGFAGESDDTEISLWRPYGERRVEDILPDDSVDQIRACKIEYAVVGEFYLTVQHDNINAWLQQHDASLVTSFIATMIVSHGPHRWYVVRFAKPNPEDARQDRG